MIFISVPYSSINGKPAYQELKDLRAEMAARACVKLMEQGETATSPLLFGLSLIDRAGKDVSDNYETWQEMCRKFIHASNQVYVLDLEGWNQSSGVKDEIAEAIKKNIPVYLMGYRTLQYKGIISFDGDVIKVSAPGITLEYDGV